jgi:hypothetical protein
VSDDRASDGSAADGGEGLNAPDLSASETLAEQALENLVNQFARPLDFLRELVQNAIDAGTPRVAVSVGWSEPAGEETQGVAQILVQDFGEGMDEPIIDSQLTRMFSSTKEDDLTKIGKFGIGFTSIFAIRPDAVLLRTGRHGENWELLFHPDRSFDKVRVDEPIAGTSITLYKRMPPAEREAFVRECRWVLRYWCEHSDTPVTFEDRCGVVAAKPQAAADPFAAFSALAPPASSAPSVGAPSGGGPELVTSPMSLDADLAVRHARDGVQCIVAFADEPAFGFYNGGLTLLRTRNTDALGDEWGDRLGHLAFKVKSNHLEHTLTRDNVLQDKNWRVAMEVLAEAADRLREALVVAIEGASAESSELASLHSWLAAECRASRAHEQVADFTKRVWLPDRHGRPVSLKQIEDQEDDVGSVLLAPASASLAQALEGEGLILLADRGPARDLLAAAWRTRHLVLGESIRILQPADVAFVLPELVPSDALPRAEAALVRQTGALLAAAAGERIKLRVGDFGGADAAADEALALEGPAEGGVFQRPRSTWFRLPAFLRRRCLLINRSHPAYRAQAVAAAEDPVLAALALAHAVLHVEGLEGEGTHRALLLAAAAAATDAPTAAP